MNLQQSDRSTYLPLDYNHSVLRKKYSDPDLICSQPDLDELAKLLSRQSSIAVDTESNSLYAYHERVCLIQFSIPGSDFLIDPLCIEDFSSLAPIFEDRGIQKIFHAAEYDLICMKRDFGFSFTNVFDTMVAARTLGKAEIGLGSLLFQEFNLLLDKKYQKADWGKRPISSEQKEYARQDTRHLHSLRDYLLGQLIDADLFSFAEEDFNRICRVKVPENADQESIWKIPGARYLSPSQAAVLMELVIAREKQAERWDLPTFKIMSSEKLLELAIEHPGTIESLITDLNFTEKQSVRHGEWIIKSIQNGKSRPPIIAPPHEREDKALRKRVERLKHWRKLTADNLHVESDIVLSREVLQSIAVEFPRTRSDLESLMIQYPVRFQHFGDELIKVLNQDSEENKA
jgi:ribonuclease D